VVSLGLTVTALLFHWPFFFFLFIPLVPFLQRRAGGFASVPMMGHGWKDPGVNIVREMIETGSRNPKNSVAGGAGNPREA
jgi:hypothetical protein